MINPLHPEKLFMSFVGEALEIGVFIGAITLLAAGVKKVFGSESKPETHKND